MGRMFIMSTLSPADLEDVHNVRVHDVEDIHHVEDVHNVPKSITGTAPEPLSVSSVPTNTTALSARLVYTVRMYICAQDDLLRAAGWVAVLCAVVVVCGLCVVVRTKAYVQLRGAHHHDLVVDAAN